MSLEVNGRPRIAVLGLGEAGGAIAIDLVAAGASVRGYDPAVPAPPGVTETGGEAEAARGSDLVLSVNSSAASAGALRAGLDGCAPGTLWADLNTASPQVKRQLDGIATERGIDFADVSLMTPVPGRGLRTPMLVSGVGARRYAGLLTPLGAPVDVLDGPAGLAAERKLLRSVFFKGLAAAVIEALAAGRAAGCEDWLRDNIADELTRADAGTVRRLVEGTHRHAVRRTAEMRAAADMLDDLGVEPLISRATQDLLSRIDARR
ncbi:NAD(P)-dependent oxidoreductase [Nonomuraea cavernae]|uniref:NAD(P)-dependent oxidoreductase n=1 Tax=Nonomuraea cavernae TaxID=2045107 RepID=UPI0033C8529F